MQKGDAGRPATTATSSGAAFDWPQPAAHGACLSRDVITREFALRSDYEWRTTFGSRLALRVSVEGASRPFSGTWCSRENSAPDF